MEKFSIVSFYWGNKQNLENYIAHASEYTDDVVIINIDLLNSFESFGIAKIMNVPYDYLFHNGHDDILNLANKHTKYDWVYYLAVGKRILNINKDLIDRNPNARFFYDKEFDNPRDKWVKLYNKNYTHWVKKVHEVVDLLPNINHYGLEDVVLEWKRCDNGNSVNKQYIYNQGEKKIYENFRQFTRLKWVSLDTQHPHPDIKNAIIHYQELKKVYSMPKEELISFLSSNDFGYLGM
jgi:hypothetical protein